MTEKGKRPPTWQAAERRGQAAARGQFALFGKGRALGAMLSKAGSWGQGADGEPVKGFASRGPGASRIEDRGSGIEGSGFGFQGSGFGFQGPVEPAINDQHVFVIRHSGFVISFAISRHTNRNKRK
jgi:hypothetical protein